MNKSVVIKLTAEQKKAVADALGTSFQEIAVDARLEAVPEARARAEGKVIARPSDAAPKGQVWVIEEIDLAPRDGDVVFDLESQLDAVSGGVRTEPSSSYVPHDIVR